MKIDGPHLPIPTLVWTRHIRLNVSMCLGIFGTEVHISSQHYWAENYKLPVVRETTIVHQSWVFVSFASRHITGLRL